MNTHTLKHRVFGVVALLATVLLLTSAATAFAAADTSRNAEVHEAARALRAQVYDHVRERVDAARQVPDEVVYRRVGDSEPFRVAKVSDVASAVRALRADPTIEYAEPNVIATIQTVDDPYYPLQWHFAPNSEGGVGAEAAWATEPSAGEGVTVAVVDTGVAYENYSSGSWFRPVRYYQAPDLAGTCFVPGYDYVQNDSHPNDDNSHGTHVAGTIAQTTNNSVGVAGLSHGACIMPLKALDATGAGTHTAIAQAVYFAADHGADVINMSLGSSEGSQTLYDALAYAHEKGVTIVAAAGNAGAGTVMYPAAYDEYVIAVGATRFDETRAGYSNYGSSLDLVAPGGDLAVDQNGDGYPDGVLQQTFNPSTKVRNEWGYYFFQGTSMAAPHVAAAAALVLAHGGASTPEEVRAALLGSAEDLGAPGVDSMYGHGLLNVPAALGPVDMSPSVSIVAPGDGMVTQSVVEVVAQAADDEAVDTVTLSVAGEVYAMAYNTDDGRYHVLWDSTSVAEGAQTLTVRAMDSAGQSSDAAVAVVVDNVNEPPTADAGADQTLSVAPGGTVTVTLEGTGSDPDPSDALSYAWYSVGPALTWLADSAVYEADLGASETDYVFMFEVADGRGGVATDTVAVSVREEVVPEITLDVSARRIWSRVYVDLRWGGASGSLVDVYRDGALLTTTSNDGLHTDKFNSRSTVTRTYRICEQGSTAACSADMEVTI